METNEKVMTPEESLKIIQRSILTSRKNMRSGSFYFLLWGWILLLSSLLCYFVLRYLHQHEIYEGMYWKSLLCWTVPIGIGFIIQWIYKRRQRDLELVKTHIDRYLTIIWVAGGITFALMLPICFQLDVYPTPFILAEVGLITFISGMMIRFTPIVIGGIVFTIAGVVSSYLTGLPQLLVFAISILPGYLLPGYLLRMSNSKNNV
ncbi:MAG: hypothetical protein ISS19_10495 [Bacteroidales bacterium]|nr:hypothetical protein [Bacteroidales bacterium]